MKISTPVQAEELRAEIAAHAARLVVTDALDYALAKRRAAKYLLGNQKIRGDILPDDQQLEQAVREYAELFFGDDLSQRLLQLRLCALDVMKLLERFNPYLVGAVLSGCVHQDSDIYLHLFSDNSKEVAIFLLNQGIQFEVSETRNARNTAIETLSFMHQLNRQSDAEGVHVLLYDLDDIRAGSRNARANLAAVQALTEQSQTETETNSGTD